MRTSERRGLWCFGFVVATACAGCSSDETDSEAAETTQPSRHQEEAAEIGLGIVADRGVELQLEGRSEADRLRVGYGSYLANAGVCDVCHVSLDGQFYGGGTPYALNLDGNLVYASNLTPDPETGLKLTEEQFVEVMRTGKDLSDEASVQLTVFPWYDYRWLSTADLKAIYAFLRALPPVSNAVPPSDRGPYFSSFLPVEFNGRFEQGEEDRELPKEEGDPDGVERGLALSPFPAELTSNLTAEEKWKVGRGSYLVNTVGHCSDCHTNPSREFDPLSPRYLRIETKYFLSGGFVFPVYPAEALGQTRTMGANLSGEERGYLNQPEDSLDHFLATIDRGQKLWGPDAPRRLGWPMPWENFRLMTREDLGAIYAYLKSIPPRKDDADKATQTIARYCGEDSHCKTEDGERCDVEQAECYDGPCSDSSECGACQTCEGGRCALAVADADCFFGGL